MMAAAMLATTLSMPAAPLGPYEASAFRLSTGAGAGESLIPAARFLFRAETIALPAQGPYAEYARATEPFADIRAWAEAPGPLTKPPLVWIAAPQRFNGARIAPDGRSLEAAGAPMPLELFPKIPLNRSYANGATFSYLARRPVTVRGERQPSGTFIARSFWPEDWRLDDTAAAVVLPANASAALAVRGLMRSAPRGGAESPFATQVIWEREPGRRDWAGHAVLGVIVNGAQGDDDEAWGGHFALATGQLPADGRLSDLLVANFYSLDVESEKGILAAPVPLDNYLGDLNSGQAWYRPTYIALALLRDRRAADFVQGAMNRLYLQFWRRQLAYEHSTMNCASISVDTLRSLGWPVRARGPANTALAWLSIPAMIFKEGKVSVARTTYEYLTEDRTRLMPAAAFEESAADLLRLAKEGAGPADGKLARWLAEDLVAIVGVRIPQIPSSRKFGTWPVANPREYLGAIPRDPADAQIVPVPPRVFPESLRDPDLLPPARRRSTVPLLIWAASGVLFLAWAAGFLWRRVKPSRP
jgi:hypothetical protein